jgi:hypothetical protein
MAKMRRRTAEMDWRPHQRWPDQILESTTESGDKIEVNRFNDDAYGYSIWLRERVTPDHWAYQNGVTRIGDEVLTQAGNQNRGDERGKTLPDWESAKAAAEEHYYSLDHSGRRTPPARDSGVDYDNLVNPQDDLNDDFGDIFGDRS